MDKKILNKKKLIVMSSLVILALIVCLIDAIIKPNYFIKVPIKICFFLVIPFLFFLISEHKLPQSFKRLFCFQRKGILKSLALGIAVFSVILGGYYLLRGVVDFSNVTASLLDKGGITADNFIYVFIYIAFCNSFLEEFFFRGYGFIILKEYAGRGFAYVFSSAVFACYHIGMLIGMFNIWVLLILLAGCIIGGMIFNYLNEANGNIYSSWFVHMFANFAINTVGLILFGIV